MSEIQDRLQQALAERYQVQRELGRGGMATVYLATDLKHEREVAIKVLHPELAATIGPERFDREIRIAAKLQHPNILGLFDSGEANGLLYYVMPFIYGESLRDRLNREHMLPVDVAVGIAIEVADALGYAHSLGIVHRDIKPENIMISGGHALVADFGIARAASGASGTAKLTETGMAVGTPLYMSPEQAVGDAVGPTADLYSLGCVLYEMLTGQPPFTGSNARQIMARHAMDAVPSIQVVRDTVSDQVEDAVMATLAKVTADRPQTAAQFIEMLGAPPGATARYAAQRASRAVTPRRSIAAITPEGNVTLTLKRRSLVGVGVSAVAGLLVVGGLLSWWMLRPKPSLAANPGGLDPHRIAVLYFEDNSPGHTLGYLSDGLTEALIGKLGQVAALQVISPNGVAPWRDPAIARDSIARALQAGTLVQGSVEPVEGKLRVQLRLVDGNSGADLSGQRASFDLPAADLLKVRDSLASEAANLIRERLGQEVRLRQERAGTGNEQAWSLVQQARERRRRGEEAVRAGKDTAFAAAFRQADSLAEAAAKLDAQWAEPLVLRGQLAYRRAYLYGQNDPQVAQLWIDSGMTQVGRATKVNPGSADALEVRGNLQYWKWLLGLERDDARSAALLRSAESDLIQATTINPAQAGAWATLSHLKNQTSGAVEVAVAARNALASDAFLDNADKIYQRLFNATYDIGQYGDAQHWCEEGAHRFPGNTQVTRCRLFLLTMKAAKADADSAWRLADSLTHVTPEQTRAYDSLYYRTLVAAVLGRAGQGDSARRVLRQARGSADIDPQGDLSLVGAFAALQAGDRKEALQRLKLYFIASPARREAFKDDVGWWFRSLQDDAEFKRLIGS